MNPSLKNSIYSYLVFSAIILTAGFSVFYFLIPQYYKPVISYVFLLFFVLSGGLHYFLLKASGNDQRKFVNRFLIATTVKLLIYFIFIGVYALYNIAFILPFLLTFLVLYLAFTLFEVISLTSFNRKIKKSREGSK